MFQNLNETIQKAASSRNIMNYYPIRTDGEKKNSTFPNISIEKVLIDARGLNFKLNFQTR